MEFAKAHWQELSASLYILLNLVNGMLNYPKDGKAKKFMRAIMDILCVLTNKDSPGTVKTPFKRSKNPHKMEMPSNGGGVAPTIILLLAGTMLAAATLPACAWFKKVSSDTLDCAYGELKDKANNIGPVIREILQSGSGGWEEALMSLALEVGQDAVDCAISAVLDNYNKHPTVSPEMAPKIDQAKERGAKWMLGKKVKL